RGALFRAFQHFVGFAEFLEPRFGVLFLAYVRVIFACQLAISLLDLGFGGVARHSHHLVIILELHPSPATRAELRVTHPRILWATCTESIIRRRRYPTELC